MVTKNGPKRFSIKLLALIAILGFGVVAVGSGYQGMEHDHIIAGLGVAIIFSSIILWCLQKLFWSNLKKTKIKSKPRHKQFENSSN